MPKKKSVKNSVQVFRGQAEEILAFCNEAEQALEKRHADFVYDVAVIKLYSAFQDLVLASLTGAINNDTAILSQHTNVHFPRHLTDEVCEFIITGNGYFDFRGRDNLIRELRKYVPESHYLVLAIKSDSRKSSLDRLCAMRNLAAHDSGVAKRAALKVIDQTNTPRSAGKWLKSKDQGKKDNRFREILDDILLLAGDLEDGAPY